MENEKLISVTEFVKVKSLTIRLSEREDGTCKLETEMNGFNRFEIIGILNYLKEIELKK